MHDIVDHQRLIDVHFQIAAGAAEADGDVVAHHLDGDHGQRFALGRIDLAGHDGRARLVLGDQQLGKSGARAARHQPDVVGDLVERDGKRAQRAGQLHQRVMGALHGEFVRRADERQAGQLGDVRGDGFGKARRGVDAGADRGAAEREAIEAGERALDAFEIVGEHARITRPFLAERERRRVLHVGAADLDDVVPGGGFGGNRIVQRLDRRHQALLHRDGGGDIHRRGKGVVGGLRHVDVIVGMNRRLAAERRAGKLAAAIGDHLVHVHVELRAAAGRPNMQRKHVLMPAGQNLVADLRDQRMDLVGKPLAGMVGVRRRLFQDGVGGDHVARRQILADAEMLERALGLRAPKLVGGDTDLAEGVGFYAEIAHLQLLNGGGAHRRIISGHGNRAAKCPGRWKFGTQAGSR